MFRSKLWALVALVACGILPPDEGALAETPNQAQRLATSIEDARAVARREGVRSYDFDTVAGGPTSQSNLDAPGAITHR